MNDKKQELVGIIKTYEAKKAELDLIRDQMTTLLSDVGVGIYIQCPETGTVYKVVKPNGTFVYFKDLDYVRTALEGERAGTLSKKEVEAIGFVLKK